MAGLARELGRMPVVPRCVVLGSASTGLVVAVVALISGLNEYAPTAWFALFEGGVIGAIAGGALGLLVGVTAYLLAMVVRRVRQSHERR